LWLDVFQKIKALGYNGVSFYVDWALVEGKQGDFSAEGIFAWEPFFEAATKAGIRVEVEMQWQGEDGMIEKDYITRTRQVTNNEIGSCYDNSR